MATWYGDTGGEVVAGDFDSDGDLEAGVGVVCTVWDSPSGGTQIVDLIDAAGISITQVTTNARGRARFGRPQDDQPAVWVQVPDGERYLFNPRNVVDRVEGVEDRVTTIEQNGGPGGAVTWDAVTGKPTTFPPSTHTHTAAQITDASNLGRTLMTAANAAAARSAIDAFQPVAGAPAVVVQAFTTASAPRVTSRTDVAVWWIGPGTTQPTNMASNDLWDQVG